MKKFTNFPHMKNRDKEPQLFVLRCDENRGSVIVLIGTYRWHCNCKVPDGLRRRRDGEGGELESCMTVYQLTQKSTV